MARQRPDAAAYARIAYAQELQGHLDAAIASMRMAAEATGAQDPESLAWHYAQVGNLLLQTGDVDGAAREFARAEHAFPGHPFAEAGRARVAVARGQSHDALTMYLALMKTAPTSDTAIAAAELLAEQGANAGADAMYARAEAIEREAWLTRNAVDDKRGANARGAWRPHERGACSLPRRPRETGRTSSRWMRWRGRITARDASWMQKRRHARRGAQGRSIGASSRTRRLLINLPQR